MTVCQDNVLREERLYEQKFGKDEALREQTLDTIDVKL